MIKILMATLLLGFSTLAHAQELPKIPSNFDTSLWSRATENPPLANYPRSWGEYPNPCTMSHLRYDDPINKPGQFSQAPLQVFVGNTRANANSTYASLRTTGEGTCFGGPLNRSTIYFPAMRNALGKVLLPDFTDVYYRGTADTKPFPRGLKMIFGPQQMDSNYVWTNESARYGWSFGAPGAWWGKSYSSQIFKSLMPAAYPDWAYQNSSYRLSVRAVSPDCWDGVNLDKPDHHSHLAYSGSDASVTNACPSTYPVKIPQATVTVYYLMKSRADIQGWYLSGDRYNGKNDPPGTNWYVGMIPAWDDDTMNSWVTKVLNTNFYGALGKLGNGKVVVIPPTSKTWAPTQDTRGHDPYFLWSLLGPLYPPVPVDSYIVDPPAP